MQVNHFRILPRAEFIRIKACELSNGHSKANSSLIQTHEGTLGFNLVKKKKKKLPLLKGSLVDQLLVCSVLSTSYHIPKLHMEL